MRTELECLACFMHQAARGARLTLPEDEKAQLRMVQAAAKLLAEADLEQSPPALAGKLNALMRGHHGVDDPFAAHKRRANDRVLQMLPALQNELETCEDTLLGALHLSLAGNLIDVGVAQEFDWEAALETAMHEPPPEAYYAFAAELRPGRELLILGDNTGEIGLDTLLVQECAARGANVTYVVRGRPILNDATMEDAVKVGMSDLCEVISSGVDTPGTVRERCSPDFLQRLDRACLVVSKGQGNYEALSGQRPGVYYGFKAKCRVVADRLDANVGDSLFIHI